MAAREVRNGLVAGAAGTVVMTAFQKLVEMPLTRREDSFVPARMTARLVRREPSSRSGWLALNYASHFTVGAVWGLALSVARSRGLDGQKRVAAVYSVVWNSDWIGLVALGVDGPPWTWKRRDLAIDVGEKLLLAEVASLTLDMLPQKPR